MTDKVGLILDVDRLRRERDEARRLARSLLDLVERCLAVEVTHQKASLPEAEETVERMRAWGGARETIAGWEETDADSR